MPDHLMTQVVTCLNSGHTHDPALTCSSPQ
jgi:hypothetical protein